MPSDTATRRRKTTGRTNDGRKGRRTMAKAKLNFTNPLFNDEATEKEPTERKTAGRGRRSDLIRNEDGGNSAQEGLPAEYTRFSVICKVSNVKDLRDYAYTKRISVKTAMDEILESFFQEYRSNPDNEPLLDHKKGAK